MTISMLVEILTGRKACESSALHRITLQDYFEGETFNELFQHPDYPALIDATPFKEPTSQAAKMDPLYTVKVVQQELKNLQLHPCCDEIMYCGITGKPLKSLVFFGVAYYQRLKHMIVDKFHSRSRGGRTTLSRQIITFSYTLVLF